jgi:membrane-associated phospholipid phosphatase
VVLGLDWFAYHDWVRSAAALRWATLAAYNSFGWQLVLVPCFLAACGASGRLMNFFAAVAAILLAVDVIYLLWPADDAVAVLGASDPVPLSWSRDMVQSIAARTPTYDVTLNRSGIVSFPSFHTAGVLIMLWALRRTVLLWPALAVNALLLLGVPAWGGHYFVDMAGGAAVAILAIMLVEGRLFTTAQSRWRSAPAQ